VTNVNVTVIHNTYNQTVNNTNVSRTSFNGGTGGTTAQPNAEERAAENEHHTPATSEQAQHEHAASTNKAQFASVNHGAPSVAASPKAGVMSGSGVVGAKGSAGANAAVHGGANSNASGAGSGKVTAANTHTGNNSQPPKNTNANAPKGNAAGSGNKGNPPPKLNKGNTPPPKGKGGNGEPKPKQHQ
jgi:hypothetical protein